MKTKHTHLFLTLLSIIIFTISSPIFAKTSVWKVSKGDDYLYIGGTIHILGKSDYPLPIEFENSYKDVKAIILETDMQKMQSMDFQMKMIDMLSYKNGEKIQDHISKATLKSLEEYLSANGVPLFTVQNFKPGMLVSMLSVIELQKLGINAEGVDNFFNNKALNDKKTLGKLETVEQQLSFLSTMGDQDTNGFIQYSLRDLKQFPTVFKSLKNAWLEGDMVEMNKIGIQPMMNEFPDTYKSLIINRNNAWIPKIEGMIKTKEIEMILVGALHLAGPDSVLTQLEARGYEVKQY